MTFTRKVVCAFAACLLTMSPRAASAQRGVGTWVKQDTPSAPAGLTMTVTECCKGGYLLVYRIAANDQAVMSLDSPLDGTDAPVLVGGQPSGETMALTRVDARHIKAVIKMNGQAFATSTSELSADGKTLTVENVVTTAAAGQSVGKTTEVWKKK